MKRTPFGRRTKWSREADELTRLATGLAESGSQVEDSFWEAPLAAACRQLLDKGKEDALAAVLEQLYRANPPAHDKLADVIEACAESGGLQTGEGEFDVLLFTAPVLAWSRYSIFSGELPQSVLDNLRVHLQAHVLAADARLALANILFSPDQLPYGYAETRTLARQLWAGALRQENYHLDAGQLPQTAPFISDIRYVVGAVAAPRGKPLFRWQEEGGSRKEAVTQWQAQGGGALQPVLLGCAAEMLLPNAYFSTCRQADIAARPFSLRAAVAFLHATLDTQPASLRAAVAPFRDQRLEEYRVGFSLDGSTEICHGVVWPLLGNEDENTDTAGEIEATLREAGMTDITLLEHAYPLEYCDDCGAALYPNSDGEILHAEMPEQEEGMPQHLH